jgi:hypothetical protein
VDVHEVVDCATLHVVLHSIHHVACAHIEDLDVGQVARPDPSRSKGGSEADGAEC